MVGLLVVAIILAISGRFVSVSCVPPAVLHGYAGYAAPDGQVLLADEAVCSRLAHPRWPGFWFALFTVVHEAEHVAGVAGERQADCVALADLRWVARRFFHLSGRLLASVLREARAYHAVEPAPYSGAC